MKEFMLSHYLQIYFICTEGSTEKLHPMLQYSPASKDSNVHHFFLSNNLNVFELYADDH